MRIPVRSETDAFHIAYGAAFLIGVSLLLGSLAGPVYGLVLFAGGLLGAVAYDIATDDPERRSPLRDALGSARRSAAREPRRRILVVANETLGGDELREELLRRGGPRPVLRVVAPTLCSRSHYVASDIDDERRQARERLDATLAWAAERGFEASGAIGDTSPLTAIEDELRHFPADEVIVSTHPPERSNWLESGVVERVRGELDVPVTHVVVDLERGRVAIAR